MNQPLKILGIAGSLRNNSYNQAALRAARAVVPEGVVFEIFELTHIPQFNQDDELNAPPKVIELKSKLRAADALLIVTPEYNHSIPGVLKNAIDWASRPYGDNAWAGKPATIMGASTGSFGTVRAQEHLRQILASLDVFVITQPQVLITKASERFSPEGELIEESTKEFTKQLLETLIQFTSWRRVIGGK
jgi:chromate reductase